MTLKAEDSDSGARTEAVVAAPSSRTAGTDGGSQDACQCTPGPWTANLEGAHWNHAGGFSVETRIAGVGLFVICGRAGVPTRADESHANARLIVAAPDLLDAAKQALTWCDRGGPIDWALITPFRDALRAAIAKAEGR